MKEPGPDHYIKAHGNWSFGQDKSIGPAQMQVKNVQKLVKKFPGVLGLTNSEGNHGEDVKECYFYLDSTPTHSYMKYLPRLTVDLKLLNFIYCQLCCTAMPGRGLTAFVLRRCTRNSFADAQTNMNFAMCQSVAKKFQAFFGFHTPSDAQLAEQLIISNSHND